MFLPDGDGFVGTILTQGGWDPDAANGGAVLALLGHCLEEVPTLVPMTMSRLTVDLVHPTPLGKRLNIVPTILREGKKIQVVLLQLFADEVELVRATALRLREEEIDASGMPPSTTDARPADALARPEDSIPMMGPTEGLPGFLKAVEMRKTPYLDGSGHGNWVRLKVPVVAGEPIRATSRLTLGIDYANLIGLQGHPGVVTMINPDVSAHILRPPNGEWVGITGETIFNTQMGRGISFAQLSDDDGIFAVVSLSQLLQRR